MKTQNKELNIELSFDRLESIVAKMESGDANLEQSLIWFEEGMELIKECQARLKKAEQKVERLIDESKNHNNGEGLDL
ncbi:MAG: exodeoxyribonuclease VII small subunit [Candidatus Marinimicrobia bacterium]|nr:exodeoxyribonuclease VII small subunit [Candidatus Neomarinimicrobiota bacterium]